MTHEEKLEYAKKNYPVGTKYKCPDNEKVYEIIGNQIKIVNDGWEDKSMGYIFYDGKWAEIISKPERKEEMTHEKAIEALEFVRDGKPVLTRVYDRVLIYAINQLKQCEVFDEPVEMRVDTCAPHDVTIKGRFKNKYISEHNAYNVEDCKPIKKKPLSFTEWQIKIYGEIVRDEDNNGVWHDGILNKKVNEYQKYLKEFES